MANERDNTLTERAYQLELGTVIESATGALRSGDFVLAIELLGHAVRTVEQHSTFALKTPAQTVKLIALLQAFLATPGIGIDAARRAADLESRLAVVLRTNR